MRRLLFLQYSLTAVIIAGFGLLAFGMLMIDFLFPETIRKGAIIQGGMDLNLVLLLAFGIQHSIMARRPVKEFMGKILPKVLVTPTYVMWSGFILFVLAALWNPLWPPLYDLWGTIWGYLILIPWGIGVAMVGITVLQMGGAELLGLNAVKAIWTEQEPAPTAFSTPGLYKFVRHPLYLGMLLIFWSTPTMTHDHLFFAEVMTAYILVGAYFEERDLVHRFGDDYLDYKQRVPMLLPFTKKRRKD